jgi:ABC-type multidrug transport system fused ATPase/permease subunit
VTEAIRFAEINVHYGATAALRDFSLTVDRGETVALLGPSGSGKSTALKALAGFERPSAGRVALFGRDVTDEPPHRRGIGLVVQQYALFPHMRVAENVAFGLRAQRMRGAEVRERVAETLSRLPEVLFVTVAMTRRGKGDTQVKTSPGIAWELHLPEQHPDEASPVCALFTSTPPSRHASTNGCSTRYTADGAWRCGSS